MNKRNVVTKENVNEVADFLENACEDFKRDEDGCYRYALTEDLAIYVGWSGGYDMADESIIKSAFGRQSKSAGWVSGYAVNVAIKIRNDADFSDFDYLDFPENKCGEIWDDSTAIAPNCTREDYINLAKYLLADFVNIVNNGYGRRHE